MFDMEWTNRIDSSISTTIKFPSKNEEKFVFSVTYRRDTDKNENVNPGNENVNDNIYRLVAKIVNDKINPENNDRPLNRPLNEDVKKGLINIIILLIKEEKLNRNMLIQKTGKGRTTVTGYLKMLRDAHIIEFIGSDKTGGYYLTQQVKEYVLHK
jgi:ATP-dependent DNA helicase RecG